MTDQRSNKIVQAAKAFAETFADIWLAENIAQRFTCDELEALCELLNAAGQNAAAERWREVHAEGDEPGDDHFQSKE